MSLGVPPWQGTIFHAGATAGNNGGLNFGGGNLPNVNDVNINTLTGNGGFDGTFGNLPSWPTFEPKFDNTLFRNGSFGLEGYTNPNPALYNKLLRAESLLEDYWSTVIVGQLMTGSNGQSLIPPV